MKTLGAIYFVPLSAVLWVCLILSVNMTDSVSAGVSPLGKEQAQKDGHGEKAVVLAALNGSVSGDKGTKDEEYEAGEISDAENVVALVNGVPIYLRSLKWAMDNIRHANKAAETAAGSEGAEDIPDKDKAGVTPDAATESMVREQALSGLIDEELAVQEAERRGIRPPSGAVSSVLSRLRSNMESPAKYDEYLAARDLTEAELRKSIARDNIFKQIMVQEVLSKIEVDPIKVKAIYEKQRSEYTFPEKVVITDLHFLPGAKEEKVREHAEQILEKLRSVPGADMMKLEPDGTFLVRTINITEESDPGLYFAVWDMEPGDISDVITVEDGLHIISVQEKRPEREMTFEEARPRIEYKLIIPEYNRLRVEFYKSLRNRAEIIMPGEDEEVNGEHEKDGTDAAKEGES